MKSVTQTISETDATPAGGVDAATVEAASEDRASVGLRLVRASGLVASGNVSSRVVALLTAIVCARLLTEIQFGVFGVVQSALNMFAIAASLNLGVAATRYVALYRATDINRARRAVMVILCSGGVSTIVMALLMISAAPWLASAWLGDSSLINPLRWAAVQLCMVSGYALVLGVLNGAERFGLSAATSVLQNVAILLGAFLLIPRFKTIGAIGAQAVGFACALAIGLWWIRDLLPSPSRQTLIRSFRDEGRTLAGFAIPVLLGALFNHPFSWMSLAIIARGEDGFKEVAFFTAADRCRLIMLFVATFVATAVFPILSRAHAKDSPDAGIGPRSLELALCGSSILLIPLSAALAFGGPQIMAAFGRSYQVNWSVLLPLIACAGAQAHLSTIGLALLAHARQWFAFAQQMFFGFIVLSLTYFLRSLGGTGLGLAHLITTLIILVVTIPFVIRFQTVTARGALVTISSAVSMCLVCLLSWLCPAAWRLLFAAPLTILTLALSAFLLTTSRERNSLRRLFSQGEWSSRRSADTST